MDMSADDYISNVLTKYFVGSFHVSQLRSLLYPHMMAWGSGHLLSMEASGSIAKSTVVATGTDTDFFLSLSSSMPGTPRDIYESLFIKCQELGISPRRQNVSIRVRYNNHSIDLVPGRRQSQYGNDHSLYVSKQDTWTQTNVQTHINTVAQCGRIDEIKLTKIWRDLRSLEFPSFYLELGVIDALQYRKQDQLADNCWEVLRFFAEDFVHKTYADPANSNNKISDDLSMTERRAIASAAAQSRQQRYWSKIVW